jgi:two-component system OmpR family sensor kinase
VHPLRIASEDGQDCGRRFFGAGLVPEARGLGIDWHLDAATTIESDPDLLRLIFQNILENAVAYAPTGSPVTVATSRSDGAFLLEVSNASELSADDAEHVFERFWRADSARQQTADLRYGLGLPLCRILAQQLGGSITAIVRDAAFTVVLQLPAA